MLELKDTVKELINGFGLIEKNSNIISNKERIRELTEISSKPDFWNQNSDASVIMQELGDLQNEVTEIENLSESISVLKELLDEDLIT